MSRIDELIEELCPEGVKTFLLRELLSRRKGISITAQKMKALHSGDRAVRIFAGGRTLVDVDSNEFETASLIKGPAIIVKSRGIIEFAFWEGVFTHKSELWSYTPAEPQVDLKFVYYYLESKSEFFVALAKSKSVKMPQLSVADTDDYEIPVPPLEVQREIVSILDKFTQLEAELEAELEARRIQYEVTRDRLFDFSGDLSTHPMAGMIREYCPEGILNRELRSCGTFKKGGSLQKKDMIEIGQPAIHYGQIHTNPVVVLLKPPTRVSDAVFSSSRVADPGDLIIADTSEDLDGVATAVAWLGDSQIAVSGHILIFSHDMEPKYVSYFFKTSEFKRQKNKRSKGVKVKDISSQRLGEVVIPVPPLEIQKEIVSILDKLDALVNDITIGLPAEIAARRKQYEYYRNKLLTFKELEAA